MVCSGMRSSPTLSKHHHRSRLSSKASSETGLRPAGRISGWRYSKAALLKPWMLHPRASLWIE
jgi:hypothetical protein